MDDLFKERAAALALNTAFGFEPKISRSLIGQLGTAASVFDISEKDLDELFGPYSKHRALVGSAALEEACRELERLEGRGYRFVSLCEEDYPALLRECPDAPAGLYVRSCSELGDIFNRGRNISVVGTRDISPYGSEWCTRIVRTIAQAPSRPTVVSGLAIGVDVTAHLCALAEGIPTIAVIPTGIEDVYPSRHRVVAEKIAAAPGSALVTDYPPGSQPVPVNFLRRNRIIAGMSGATVLIESKAKGGGTMTARLASGYGREVFCLPGRVDDSRSAGCNLLIQEKIAEPIISLSTLPQALGLGRFSRRKAADLEEELSRRYGDARDVEAAPLLPGILKLVRIIRKQRGIDLDNLCRQSGMGIAEVTEITGLLESDGIICTDILRRCSINLKFV